MASTSTTRKPVRKQAHAAPVLPIPDKLYFRIGEVARLCAVQAFVLRFWESEFSALHPNKSGTGQRLYRRRDVETALRIRHLLYEEGYTIAGARQALKHDSKPAAAPAEEIKQRPLQFSAASRTPAEVKLDRLRQDLRSLLVQLSTPVTSGAVQPHKTRAINSGSREGNRIRRAQPLPDTGLF